ncbi:hypothetical protein [Metapseudomonas otitidis]|uniref:hypothetical protein n=1 Tax=Metapseudomonas otitidis TaxID=319939 RepID=UPI002448EF1F|nr:hypothetical protein [Pseudomonas otitidis]MDG9780289.1 hypothetical protein [Pseudomonas otitidis]
MSDEKVTPFRKRPDPIAELKEAEINFEGDLLGAIKVAKDAQMPDSMIIGVLYRVMNDLDFGAIVFLPDGDEPA